MLDLACGNARLYQAFVEKGTVKDIEYVGVDFSEALLELARARFPDIDVRLGEMTRIPCPDESFDIVFCLAAFHHLSADKERVQTLREIRRVLKPRGMLVMTNWNLHSGWAKKKLETGKWRLGSIDREMIVPWKDARGAVIGERLYYAYTPEDIAKWCEIAGLVVEKQFDARGMNIVSIATRQS